MKKIISITLFIALMSSISLTSCLYENTYEDGPMFRLQTKKMRLVNEWKVEKIYIGGNIQPTDPLTENQTIQFKSNGDYIYSNTVGPYAGTFTGTWAWNGMKNGVLTDMSTSGLSTEYLIFRLKANELWVYDNNRSEEIHYVSK